MRLNNGRTVEQQLIYEAERFRSILEEEIQNWYSSYTPVKYLRTYSMQQAIAVDNYVKIELNGQKLSICIKFTDRAIHESLWGGSVNTLLLLNDGYSVSKGWHKDIPNFGYRNGGYFLEKALARFNQDNTFGIQVSVDY